MNCCHEATNSPRPVSCKHLLVINPDTMEFKMVKLFTPAPLSVRIRDRAFDLYMPHFKNIRWMVPSDATFIEWTLIESAMLAQHCLLYSSRQLILDGLGG